MSGPVPVEEDAVPHLPPLELADARFLLNSPDTTAEEKAAATETLRQGIEANNMTAFYTVLCTEQGWAVDQTLFDRMEAANTAKMAALEAAIADATANLGENEVREALLAKAEQLCRVGDKAGAEAAYAATLAKTVSVGQRIDAVFALCRLAMFYGDDAQLAAQLQVAEQLMETGGDWDRRNRLKVYQAVRYLAARDFARATPLLLAAVATFTSYEIMPYARFVEYAVLASLLTLDRVALKKSVVDGPEIQHALHGLPGTRALLAALYGSCYAAFFGELAAAEPRLRRLRLVAAHRVYVQRELRLRAYAQLLASYRAVTLPALAAAFGVTPQFVDADLSAFIAARRLACRIDMVGGVVETLRPDAKNALYERLVQEGDALLSRIQKLGQLVRV